MRSIVLSKDKRWHPREASRHRQTGSCSDPPKAGAGLTLRAVPAQGQRSTLCIAAVGLCGIGPERAGMEGRRGILVKEGGELCMTQLLVWLQNRLDLRDEEGQTAVEYAMVIA